MDGGRFDRAEGGLLAADRASRRASEWAEAAGVTLEEVNAAVQEVLAIALKKAVRSQLDPN